MLTNSSIDLPVKPRVLIADDSRIVRATLIKHIEGMFEFREALDGEQAWETLLLDPNIRVVITDLTMPKLDGYGLLQRIRSSKINRIRNIPVVVVSGSDEREERDRAKAAGATDLITKGIGTAQLLSRLDILSKLVITQGEFERGLEALIQHTQPGSGMELSSPETLTTQAQAMLASALRQGKNFVLLHVRVGLRHAGLEGQAVASPTGVVDAIGQLLQGTVRQTDCVARTGEAEFTLATGNIHFDSARNFAQRVCGAISRAHLSPDGGLSIVASCGMLSLSEFNLDADNPPALAELREVARQRANLGMDHGVSGVVGQEQAAAFLQGEDLSTPAAALPAPPGEARDAAAVPDSATLLRWLKEGKQDQVQQYVGKLPVELQPLVDLMMQQSK